MHEPHGSLKNVAHNISGAAEISKSSQNGCLTRILCIMRQVGPDLIFLFTVTDPSSVLQIILFHVRHVTSVVRTTDKCESILVRLCTQ